MADGVYSQLYTARKTYEADKKAKEEEPSFWEKAGTTILDVFTEIGGGFLNAVEGLVDAGIGLLGGAGSLIGIDNQWAEDIISFDATQEWYYSWEDELTKNSALNDSDIAKGVFQGIGQQLPTIAAVALAPVTGGASLAVLPYTRWGTILSAGGQGMEEALNDGADYGEALLYGVTQGGIEWIAEKGTDALGKGISTLNKTIGSEATKTVGKVVAEEAASEFLEEGFGALIDPVAKMTYQGTDSLSAYADMSFYQDAFEQALVGGIVGGLTSGAGEVTRIREIGGAKNYAVADSVTELSALDEKANNLFTSGKLTEDKLAKINSEREEELQNLQRALQKMNESDRKAAIERFNLSSLVDENGMLLQNSDFNGNLTQDGQTANQTQNGHRKPLASDNIQAYSPSLRNTELLHAPTQNNLTQAAQDAKKLMGKLTPNLRMVVTNELAPNVNAEYDTQNKILYVSENISSSEFMGHEITHSLEGTEAYETLAKFVLNSVENLNERLAKTMELYKDVNTEAKSGENGLDVAIYEARTEIVAEEMGKILSDEASIQRIVNQNKGVAYKIWQWIKDSVTKLSKRGAENQHYKFLRKAEKLFAKAIKNSYGGVTLTDVRKAIDEEEAIKKFEEEGKKELENLGKNVANSEPLRYNKKRYAPRDASEVSKNDFQHHYWAVANEIVSEKEISDFTEKVGQLESGTHFEQNADGLYMIPVGENGVNNKIIFTDGKYNSPSINYVVEINSNNETDLSVLREELYVSEIKGIQKEFGELFKYNYSKDFEFAKFEESRNSGNGRLSRGKQNGTGTSGETRYSLKQDSNGNKLTQSQQEFFKDSKVVDENGDLLVMYHGSSKADITEFNIEAGTYFTASKEYATRYGKGGKVYEVYLNMENPFDTRNVKAKQIFEDEFYGQWGNGANLTENGVPDWTDGYDLVRFLKEKGYDYDGVIVDEGADFGYFGDIVPRGLSYIVFDKQSQVKLASNKNPTGSNDIRYSLKDSNGRELSKPQAKFFKDSVVKDENGNLKVVYHGSSAQFTEFSSEFISDWNAFGDGYYFTDSKNKANGYAKNTLLETYLDIKNPLNSKNKTQLEAVYKKLNLTREEVMNYAKKEGLSGSDLFILNYYADENKLNVTDAIRELGFDGIVSENFEDTEYVVFSSNQIKETSNINPTLSSDIRYSLNKDKDIRSLVAIHNTSEAKLLQSMELGGLPMPSIAVVKSDMGHEGFGNISLIFKADAIDPQANYDNKVYSADAYSPRFPRTAYSLNSTELRKLADKIDTSVAMLDANEFAEGQTREQIINALMRNDNFVDYYIKEFQIEQETVYKKPTFSYGLFFYDEFKTVFQSYSFHDVVNEDFVRTELENALQKAKERQTIEGKKRIIQNFYDNFVASIDDARNDRLFYEILEEQYNNDKLIADGKIERVVDSYATRQNTLEKLKNDKKFNTFVEESVDKVLNKKYLRNNKDYYSSSGNPRSFNSLYDEYNAENAVRIMKEQGSVNSEGGNVFGYGIGEIRAALSKMFESISEMHQSESRLQNTSEESSLLYEECENNLHELGNEIAKRVKTGNFMEDHDIALNAIFDIISKTKTNEQAKRLIKREYSFEVTDFEIEKMRSLAEKVKNLPVKYFEAKPERVVRFEEIAKVFVPKGTSEKILNFFEEKNIDVEVYSENSPTRAELVKLLPDDIRFSLKEGEGNYDYSKGQISKYVAERSRLKAYSKTDAEKIVNTIVSEQLGFGDKYGVISGKTKNQVIDTLWHALNTKNAGYRADVALDIAQYIIDNTVMEDLYASDTNEASMAVVGTLKNYLHNVDLSGIKSEIKNHYDKDNSPYLLWGRRQGTSGAGSPDTIAMELASQGIHLQSTNEADLFFEMDEMYRKSVKDLKKAAKQRLAEVVDSADLKLMKQSIANEILRGYDETGHKTRFAETIERYTSKISMLQKAVKEIKANNVAKNNVVSTIERLRDKFVKNHPAGWNVPEAVQKFVKEISKVETWRNNISQNARTYMSELEKQIDNVLDESQKQIYPFREEIAELARGNGELTTQELQTLDKVLRQFEWQLKNYDKVVFEGKSQSNTEISLQGVKESKQASTMVKNNNVIIRLKNKVYTNPYDRLAELGLYRDSSVAKKLYKDMLEGDRKRATFSRDASMLFDDFFKKNKKYLTDLQKDITVTDGENSLTLSKRQALTIYATSLREQGRGHLYNVTDSEGVIKLLDNKLSTKGKTTEAFARGRDVRITKKMVADIKNKLTKTDTEYLDLVKKFFNENSKKAKTETDNLLYGITNVEDGYYFPIKVSSDKIYTEIGQNKNINQYILDMGMNKATKPNANNKIVIDGIDNILASHIQSMSLYYGYAVPLMAYNRIMNKQVLDTDGTDMSTNMRSEIQKFDVDFEKYMNDLWKDIQGISAKEKGWLSDLMSNIRWAGSTSALAANPKVWTTQTISLASGTAELDYKYVAKGMSHFFNGKEKVEMAKYSSLMWERNVVGNSVDIAEIRQVGKQTGGKLSRFVGKVQQGLNTFTTTPISWMDSNVINSLWYATQYEVADKFGKGYEFGTEANKIEAGKRLDEVVFRTQQTSDALGRSAWMRSDNELIKFARMFTGDAMQLAGKMTAAVNQYRLAKKMIQSSDSELVSQGQAMIGDAKKNLAKASASFVMNQAMLLAVAMAFKWLKGKDDDEEWSEIAQNELIANLMGMIPLGGDIFDKLQGYEPTNMAYTALSDTVEAVQDIYESMVALATGEYVDDVSRNKMIRNTALGISRLTGIPLSNLESYIKGIVGKVSPASREEYEALFKTKSNTTYLEKIRKATENGDEELANSIINIMFDSKTGKIKDDKVMDVTRELIEAGYDVVPTAINSAITYEGTTYTLTNKQYKNFTKIYSQATDAVKTMVNSSIFSRLSDEAKANAMNYIYDYYYDLALEDMLGVDLIEKDILFAEAIPISTLAMAIAQAKLYTADTDKSGNSISGTKKTKVQSFIQSLNLTATQKYMIMGYLGYSNSNGASQVQSYINRLSLSDEQKAQLYLWSGYST